VQKAAGTFPPTQYFNQSGRAYPDVATIGHNLLIRWGGGLVTVDGTSASGPIMAGVVSLLNEARLNAGKSSLGLLNPMFYKVRMQCCEQVALLSPLLLRAYDAV
jgi:tripeptidyl-peptidase-1